MIFLESLASFGNDHATRSPGPPIDWSAGDKLIPRPRGPMRITLVLTATRDDRFVQADASMARYAQGDDSAFLDLYDALAPALFGFLLRFVRQKALAEDLMQQTFLQIHAARGRFVSGSPVRPWAFAIARRLFIDHTRRAGRELVSGDEERVVTESLEHQTPGDWHDAREAATRAEATLGALPEAQREAYLLVKLEGLSLADAALVLGSTTTAVKLRVHRAVVALRTALNADPGSTPGGTT